MTNVSLLRSRASVGAALAAFLAPARGFYALLSLSLLAALCAAAPAVAQQTTGGSHSARPLITSRIDQGSLVALPHNVRRDLSPDKDLGAVEDGFPIRLYLILKRSPEQQADLDAFIARQQQPGSPDYHKWLTPQQFGERFGAAQSDIAKITQWLQSQGFEVKSILNNASMIDFQATAGGVRNTFHTQLHYWNVQGGKYPANIADPQIPAALSGVVAGITGLSKIPPPNKHTPIHPVVYDIESHTWHSAEATKTTEPGGKTKYSDGNGGYNLSPRDFYKIYNSSPIYAGGNLGAGAVISLPEPTDFNYGTPNATTGATTGGDVATFRSVFGVGGTLNMIVLHGPTAANPACGDPGITSAEGEAVLDSEWSNAVAPNAQIIFMSCNAGSMGDGFTTALITLIDNNISDIISSSYGSSEAVIAMSDVTLDTMLTEQAATQGQTFIDAAGDAGSADADQNGKTVAVQGLNIDQFAGTPLVTAVGGTDFQDKYDADEGGLPQSTYWGANSTFYNDALKYIPETPWNGSCADSIIAADSTQNGTGTFTGAGYCGALNAAAINGTVSGGGGGFSVYYSQPAYQTGTPGLSSTAPGRAAPDISFFAASGFWGHYLLLCDSYVAPGGPASTTGCANPPTDFGGAGGTSFTAPQFAGVTALLITLTGERQGFLNPGIYALARAQYAGPNATACYSNGQTNNTGVTTGAPAASCIFNDVTTGNNDEPCAAGGLNCYVNPGKTYGILTAPSAAAQTVAGATLYTAYPATADYDEATGLGSLNIANFINSWSQAQTSSLALVASPNSIPSSQSTSITATVTGTQPAGATGYVPAVQGSVAFTLGATPLGSCTLSGSPATCSIMVAGSALQPGSNIINATYTGTGTYPQSANTVMVTQTSSSTVLAAINSPSPNSQLTGTSATFMWSKGTGLSGYELYIGAAPGGNSFYSGNPIYTTSFTVNGLPMTGQPIYVRLWSRVGNGWQYNDYTYTAAMPTLATMNSPTPGTQISGSTADFTWTAGVGLGGYALYVGTSVGSGNIFYKSGLETTSQSVSKIPTNGSTIYVRLWSRVYDAWQYNDYTYKTGPLAPDVSTAFASPAPSSGATSPGLREPRP